MEQKKTRLTPHILRIALGFVVAFVIYLIVKGVA